MVGVTWQSAKKVVNKVGFNLLWVKGFNVFCNVLMHVFLRAGVKSFGWSRYHNQGWSLCIVRSSLLLRPKAVCVGVCCIKLIVADPDVGLGFYWLYPWSVIAVDCQVRIDKLQSMTLTLTMSCGGNQSNFVSPREVAALPTCVETVFRCKVITGDDPWTLGSKGSFQYQWLYVTSLCM
jgi:hypothetical protein